MSSKAEKDRQKQIQDRCQALLTQMLRDDDNKYCVDCDAKGPRWASWNLGIFLCIRCAGIHRNLGVHISKVKSVNLDSWTPEQVVSLEQMGNSRARAVYEANLPDNFRRPQNDSALESFIRAKYEHKKYIAREWCPPPLPKVNWDKEIEEEEKLKKKKRENKNSMSVINNTVVKKLENVIPAPLPKPVSSPKSNRNIHPPSTPANITVQSAQSASADLLGLDTPSKEKIGGSSCEDDELFGNLVSAEPVSQLSLSSSAQQGTMTTTAAATTTTPSATSQGRSQEEENFFSQPTLSTATGDKKLTKDSILALYSTQPAHFTGGGGVFVNQQQFGSQQAFPQLQNGPNNLHNSLLQQQGNPPTPPSHHNLLYQQQQHQNNPANIMHHHNSTPRIHQSPPHQHNIPQMMFPNPLGVGAGATAAAAGAVVGGPASNPFYRMSSSSNQVNSAPPSLTHQLSGLNLGPTEAFAPQQQHHHHPQQQQQSTISHNIWQ